jgi:hypothetical protein
MEISGAEERLRPDFIICGDYCQVFFIKKRACGGSRKPFERGPFY